MLLASKACRRALTRSFVRQETVRTKFSLASMFGRSKQKKTFTLTESQNAVLTSIEGLVEGVDKSFSPPHPSQQKVEAFLASLEAEVTSPDDQEQEGVGSKAPGSEGEARTIYQLRPFAKQISSRLREDFGQEISLFTRLGPHPLPESDKNLAPISFRILHTLHTVNAIYDRQLSHPSSNHYATKRERDGDFASAPFSKRQELVSLLKLLLLPISSQYEPAPKSEQEESESLAAMRPFDPMDPSTFLPEIKHGQDERIEQTFRVFSLPYNMQWNEEMVALGEVEGDLWVQMLSEKSLNDAVDTMTEGMSRCLQEIFLANNYIHPKPKKREKELALLRDFDAYKTKKEDELFELSKRDPELMKQRPRSLNPFSKKTRGRLLPQNPIARMFKHHLRDEHHYPMRLRCVYGWASMDKLLPSEGSVPTEGLPEDEVGLKRLRVERSVKARYLELCDSLSENDELNGPKNLEAIVAAQKEFFPQLGGIHTMLMRQAIKGVREQQEKSQNRWRLIRNAVIASFLVVLGDFYTSAMM